MQRRLFYGQEYFKSCWILEKKRLKKMKHKVNSEVVIMDN